MTTTEYRSIEEYAATCELDFLTAMQAGIHEAFPPAPRAAEDLFAELKAMAVRHRKEPSAADRRRTDRVLERFMPSRRAALEDQLAAEAATEIAEALAR